MAGGGSRPGERRGGRRKGSRNKVSSEAAEKLARLGCDPLEGMARIALGDLVCPACAGSGRARYAAGPTGPVLDPDAGAERTCRTCWGGGREPVSPELRGRMFAELAQYVAPKRKAVEHSGPQGEAIRHDHRHGTLPDYDRLSLEELQAELAEDMAGGGGA